MGGSFNPVHLGHLEMVKAAHSEYGLDNIVFMPNKSTYYKDNDKFAPDKDRINMINLMIKDYPYLSVSDMEIKRGGISITLSGGTEAVCRYSPAYKSGSIKNSSCSVYFVIPASWLILRTCTRKPGPAFLPANAPGYFF